MISIRNILIASIGACMCTVSVFANTTSPLQDQLLQKLQTQLQDTTPKEEKPTIIKTPKTEEIPVLAREKFIGKPFEYTDIWTGKAIQIKHSEKAHMYVQILDISQGAKLGSALSRKEFDTETGEPLFVKHTLSDLSQFAIGTPISFINGQYFNPTKNPTMLSFALKSEGVIYTAGADFSRIGSPLSLLIIEDTQAKILPYNWKNIENATGDFAIATYPFTRKSSIQYRRIGQTAACLLHTSTNTSPRLAFFFLTQGTEWTLRREMQHMGCSSDMSIKFDSSGSSQLFIPHLGIQSFGDAEKFEPDYRKIPHAIAIYDRKK